MQSAKDSFYLALRNRLGAVNPQRTMVRNGVTQPAILVLENQAVTPSDPPDGAFCLRFGAAHEAKGFQRATRRLMVMECAVRYGTRGMAVDGSDRARVLSALDSELLQICTPSKTPKRNHAESPAQSLGSYVFWTRPRLEAVQDEGGLIARDAVLNLFYFPEVDA